MPQLHAFPIAVLNRATDVTDDEAWRVVEALKIQASRDFAKVWGIDARLKLIRKNVMTGWEGKWNLVLLDNSDEATALGYHDVTPDGLPLGKVFVTTVRQHGAQWSVTASHELLEMLLDPYINLVAEDTARGIFVAYEACDSVEHDDHGYYIDVPATRNGPAVAQVLVSDFVTPEFFDPTAAHRSGERYSFRDLPRADAVGAARPRPLLTAPFQLAKGGYEAIYVPGRGWTQRTNFHDIPTRPGHPLSLATPFAYGDPGNVYGMPGDRPKVGSRRERRWTQSRGGPNALTPSIR